MSFEEYLADDNEILEVIRLEDIAINLGEIKEEGGLPIPGTFFRFIGPAGTRKSSTALALDDEPEYFERFWLETENRWKQLIYTKSGKPKYVELKNLHVIPVFSDAHLGMTKATGNIYGETTKGVIKRDPVIAFRRYRITQTAMIKRIIELSKEHPGEIIARVVFDSWTSLWSIGQDYRAEMLGGIDASVDDPISVGEGWESAGAWAKVKNILNATLDLLRDLPVDVVLIDPAEVLTKDGAVVGHDSKAMKGTKALVDVDLEFRSIRPEGAIRYAKVGKLTEAGSIDQAGEVVNTFIQDFTIAQIKKEYLDR